MRWFRRGAAAVVVAAVCAAAGYELRGRALRRRDAALAVPCADRQVVLRDGRRLGYRETGAAAGEPVLYFHGALGSRLEWPASPDAAAAAGVRLIAIARAGYGCSEPAPRHTIEQSVDDVRQLADALGVPRFRAVAWSAGTVFAIACAARMPERVTRLDLVGAAVPESYPEGRAERDRSLAFFAGLTQRAPGIAYALLRRTIARREGEPEWFEQELERSLSPVDRAITTSPAMRPVQMRSHAAGEARLAAGIIGDLEAAGGDWGFRPVDVKAPVTMWQGSEDTLTPETRNRRLLREFPNVQLRRFEGEGHFLLYRHERELLAGK